MGTEAGSSRGTDECIVSRLEVEVRASRVRGDQKK